MKKVCTLVLLSSLLWTCSNVIEVDNNPFQSPNPNEEIDLGTYSLNETSVSFSPYANKTDLIFVDEDGAEYTFRMVQPSFTPFYKFTNTFSDPNDPQKDLDYTYRGDRYEYEFLCIELGAKFEVLLRPSVCTNPDRETEGVVNDHLQIFGRGFLLNDVQATTPALDVNISAQNLCNSGSRLGEITYLDRTFNNVYQNELLFRGQPIEIFYTQEQGIVAFRTEYLFAVLDQIF